MCCFGMFGLVQYEDEDDWRKNHFWSANGKKQLPVIFKSHLFFECRSELSLWGWLFRWLNFRVRKISEVVLTQANFQRKINFIYWKICAFHLKMHFILFFSLQSWNLFMLSLTLRMTVNNIKKKKITNLKSCSTNPMYYTKRCQKPHSSRHHQSK